jgi:hypothetical protein
MSWPVQDDWSDEEILTALDMRDHDGASYGKIEKANGRRSRSACIGRLRRVDEDTDATDPDGNQNGTMPRGWWRR